MPGAAADHTVDASATIVSALASGTTIWAVLADYSSTNFFHCAVRQDNPQAELFSYNAPSNQWTSIDVESRTVSVGQSYRLVARASANDQNCAAAGANLDGNAGTFNGTRIGFRIREMVADVAYVAVYRSP
jgi:hypothetical protein